MSTARTDVSRDEDTAKERKVQLTFAGCGGMYNYALGVAAVIQSKFVLDNVVIAGSSAGCFPAMLLALGLDVRTLFESWNIPFLQEVNSKWMGALTNWNGIVRKWTMKQLPKDAYKRLNGRFHVSHSNVHFSRCSYSLSNNMVSDWQSNNDLLDGIIASSFIPLFDIGKMTMKFRGNRVIDGSFTNSYPLPLGENVPSLVIRRDMWRQNKKSWLWCWTDAEWARKQFAWGNEDALANLNYLGSILTPRSI